MAQQGRFKHWISLIISRFGRSRNLDGNYRAIEAAAIPTVTMLANWAKKDTKVSEMWVFGSVLDPKRWNSLDDDLDVLLIVPDKFCNHETARNLRREAPLSDQYLRTDIRVKKESECEPWIELARRNMLPSTSPDKGKGDKESLVESVFRHGVCVWRRDQDPDSAKDEQQSE